MVADISVADISTPTKADSLREHELYRYYRPILSPTTEAADSAPTSAQGAQENTLAAHAASSPDTTLTALAQLTAIRLHASRAMISVIDREKQYFIAESTKSLKLSDTAKCEVNGDELWIGCSTVDKSGRLCEKTIELPPTLGRPPCFTVTDLSKDGRFNQLPFVTGPPYFRFYAGTPLTTKKGINIGSLFVIDDKARPSLGDEQEEFLGTMASIVMKHMEITSEAEERKKITRMSEGLNSFVEGKSHLNTFLTDPHAVSSLGSRSHARLENGSPRARHGSQGSGADSAQKSYAISHVQAARDFSHRPHRAHHGNSTDQSEDSQDEADPAPDPKSVDASNRTTCARAASLLSESLNLDGHSRRGGVVFLDTTWQSRQQSHRSSGSYGRNESTQTTDTTPAEIISQTVNSASFTPLDMSTLQSLLKRYPRGKLWSFGADGALSSSEDDARLPAQERRVSEGKGDSQGNRRQRETNLFQKHFPGVRQLMFTGLWDAAASRWFLGAFAWTTSRRHIFSVDPELTFCRAFGNSVMAEVSRLASIAADRQKADFIGSISHEFRSPLHGILASAEFLSQTEADAFQSSLVDTISSCGRTLLDTINHILDYSKINTFERNWRNGRKPHRRGSAVPRTAMRQENGAPMMNIYAQTNVAAITEEVVEGVYAGQIYQDISSTEATDFSTAGQADAQLRGINMNSSSRRTKLDTAKQVEVMLSIPCDDYVFITQPGALKRVIMNIFGNALKYTQKGSILVELGLDPVDLQNESKNASGEQILQIKITDTGKGISKEYLRTSLYNPFCQEDVLASGTGLGLSIVRSIVTMLNGSIDVQSEVGVGTEVTMRLPLSRTPGTDTPVSTPSSAATNNTGDESIVALTTDYSTATIAMYGFETESKECGRCIRQSVEDWYGLRAVSGLPGLECGSPSLVIVDETSLLSYLKQRIMDVPTIVLCGTGSRAHPASRLGTPSVVEFMSKPFGPYKLAKSIRACLDKSRSLQAGLRPAFRTSDTNTGSMSSGTETAMPGFQNLTLETGDIQAPIEVVTNDIVTASYTGNARMAVDQPFSDPATTDASVDTAIADSQAFPFPSQSNDESEQSQSEVTEDQAKSSQAGYQKPEMARRATAPLVKTLPPVATTPPSQAELAGMAGYPPPESVESAKDTLLNEPARPTHLTLSNMALHNGEKPSMTPGLEGSSVDQQQRPPRLLLVDDNKINLRLLETFMKKRKYKSVDSAENGLLAVQAAAAHSYGYDIIFMDISMPVMNGFEATRAIRDMEEERQSTSPPALIIALTGLASGRDQTEAFTSGVDLFMTKPVSFKEVGQLLDNWEANRGASGVPGHSTAGQSF